ncbi:MAG TPA: hypothetical protein PLC48_09280 [Ferruginibacter sp.]|nr:hypothetical protein [Ferruginibacter sp.]
MWLDIVKESLKEIKELIDKKGKKRAKVYDAIEAINKAANRTSIFISKSISGTYKSDQELSDMWLEAAKTVRELDDDLYLRLLGKAEYWSNPEEWPDDKVKQVKSSLLEIKREARALLKKKSKSIKIDQASNG